MCLFSMRLCVCAYACFIPATLPHWLRQEGRWQLSQVTWWRIGCHKWVVNIYVSCMQAVTVTWSCGVNGKMYVASSVQWQYFMICCVLGKWVSQNSIDKVNTGWLVYLCFGYCLTIPSFRAELCTPSCCAFRGGTGGFCPLLYSHHPIWDGQPRSLRKFCSQTYPPDFLIPPPPPPTHTHRHTHSHIYWRSFWIQHWLDMLCKTCQWCVVLILLWYTHD